MIQLYIYNLSDGRFLYEDTGGIDIILSNLDVSQGFSMLRPPNYKNDWYWIDDEWQAEPKT